MASTPENYEFYVGEHSSMEGAEMTITGVARVDGRLVGKIHADHLIVGESGFVSGEISGESAEIWGTLEQSITVSRKLKVMGSGKVSGQISYGSIDVDEGARITGTLQNSGEEGASAPPAASGAGTSDMRLDVVARALDSEAGEKEKKESSTQQSRSGNQNPQQNRSGTSSGGQQQGGGSNNPRSSGN